MPLIPLRPVLESTYKNHYAHGAFNVNTVAQAQAVIEAHETFRSVAILQGADLANAFMGGRPDFLNGTLEDKILGAKRIVDAVNKTIQHTSTPVVMHLDHGRDVRSVRAAIDGGYTSVMIDGSNLAYDDNVELTREVVRLAHREGVTVEGELGVLAGVEDDVFSETSSYTNPMKVCDFFRKTKVDCLAISYGTKHGAVKGTNVKLRQEIVIASMENLRHEGIFGVLVSHGSSTIPPYLVKDINSFGGTITNAGGIPISELKQVIPLGIGKINIDTDIRLAITRNIREYFLTNPQKKRSNTIGAIWEVLNERPDVFDPRTYLTSIMLPLITGTVVDDPDMLDIILYMKRGVREVVGSLIVEFGSVGDTSLVEKVSLSEMADRYKIIDR